MGQRVARTGHVPATHSPPCHLSGVSTTPTPLLRWQALDLVDRGRKIVAQRENATRRKLWKGQLRSLNEAFAEAAFVAGPRMYDEAQLAFETNGGGEAILGE